MLPFVADDPVIQQRIEIGKGLAFVAICSGLLFALLRRWQLWGAQFPGRPSLADALRGAGWRFALTLTLIALSVPVIGFSAFGLQAARGERDTGAELALIASFKVRQIENWLAERRGDATSLAMSRGFVERVQAVQRSNDARERRLVTDRLVGLLQAFAYNGIALVDEDGNTVVTVGEPEPMTAEEGAAAFRKAVAAGEVRMSDMHAAVRGAHLHFSVPLFAEASGPAAAVALLYVDAGRFLFPLVQSWPTASETGRPSSCAGSGTRSST